MNRSIILIIIALILLTACNQAPQGPTLPNYNQGQNSFKYTIEKNKHVCIMESGVKIDDTRYVRNLAKEIIQYLKHQNFDRISPYLTAGFKQKLESKDIQNKKLDVFLPNASVIMPAIENYQLQSIFFIKTNPESTEISGVCHGAKKNPEKSMHFDIKNPSEDQVGMILVGRRGTTSANVSIIAVKDGKDWKINHIGMYPGGAASNSSYNLYTIASQYQKQGKNNLSYLYYRLITDITPREPVLLEYVINSYNALKELNVILPTKTSPQKWAVDENEPLEVYELKILPVNNKLVLFLGYITQTDDININNQEAALLTEYVKKIYPDLGSFFDTMITEATFEIPEGENYQRYAKANPMRIKEIQKPAAQTEPEEE